MSTPSTVNTPAKTAAQVINFAVFQLGIKTVKAKMVAAFPFLAWPVISQVVDILLNWIGVLMYENSANFVTFTIINFQTAAQKNAYIKAEGELRKAELSGNPEVFDEATKKFKSALADVVHWNGSYTPT